MFRSFSDFWHVLGVFGVADYEYDIRYHQFRPIFPKPISILSIILLLKGIYSFRFPHMFIASSRLCVFPLSRLVVPCATNEQRACFSIMPPKKFLGFRVTHGNQRLFRRKLVRRFTLECLSRFGSEVEDVKLILGNQHSYFRKLPHTKRRQFSELYKRGLENLMTGDVDFRGILITRIHVPMIMKHIHIHWRCTGDVQRDEEIEQVLEKHADELRKKLAELFFNTPIPPLVFVEDRQHLYEQELNRLLEIADYGMQYRAVSPVGAILGSSSDTGTKSVDPNDPTVPKEQMPPRWLENWRRRVKAAKQKKSDEKMGEEPKTENTENV